MLLAKGQCRHHRMTLSVQRILRGWQLRSGLFLFPRFVADTLQLIQPIAKSFDQKGQFFGIGLAGRFFGNVVPVGLRKLRAIRIAVVSHAGPPAYVALSLLPCSPANTSQPTIWSTSATVKAFSRTPSTRS